MKHTGPRGKIVKVEGSGGNETLQNKVAQVWRALSFYQSVVEKTIPDMLPGSATVVLEMILHLNAALKPCFANQDSSEVASVVVNVNHSLAELVRWSDQLLLHGEETHHTATVQEVCRNVRVAVENLVALAADKDNLDLDATCNSIDNNNSITSHKSTPGYSERTSVETNSTNNHRNSLPEILSLTPTETKSDYRPKKLSHSVSSDSIINNKEEESPPPKPPIIRHPSFDDKAPPPLPPKKNSRGKNVSPVNGMGSPVHHSTPISSGEWGSAMHGHTHSTGGDWGSNTVTRHSAGSGTLTSHDESSDQVSPASSLDSMNHSHDDLMLNHVVTGDFGRAIQINCIQPFAHHRATHPLRNLEQFCDSELLSLQSTDSGSSSSGYQSISSQTNYMSLGHSSSVSTIQESRQHSQAFFRHETSSSHSQVDSNSVTLAVPPPLPEKRTLPKRRKSGDRIPSQYDNVHSQFDNSRLAGAHTEDTCDSVDHVELRRNRVHKYHNTGAIYSNGTVERRHMSGEDPSPALPPKISTGGGHLISSNSSSSSSVSSGISCTSNSSPGSLVHMAHHRREVYSEHYLQGDGNPPPLPPKKKHGIQEYMDIIGPYGEPNINEIVRHSDYMVQYYESEWPSADRFGTPWETSRYTSVIEGLEHLRIAPPALPPKQKFLHIDAPPTKPALIAPQQRLPITYHTSETIAASDNHTHAPVVAKSTSTVVIPPHAQDEVEQEEVEEEEEEEETVLDLLDVRDLLVLKKGTDDGPEIKGGEPDALIVHASKANKNEFLYQEAFLTTYRTFVEPPDLVSKLLYRYHKFTRCQTVMEKQKASRNAFSLLVRVVDDLTVADLTKELLETLTEFEYELLCCGDLLLARALRRKIVEKLEARKRYLVPRENLTTLGVTTKQATLLDFKSHDIAEQMTLLDAELFQIMEIPEVLTWSREQNEEKSPNLTTFTEHFNKMSYWARSQILDQENDARDREKYVMKFIKIMKHLRKVNNFNSYLAILSALDSAPIRRLEWQRTILDGLKEYCALIDSSASFKIYRQALSETTPPCIPYIGLILQDLTFIHIGNQDLHQDKTINFSKRWQLFNILDNMKRFKKCQYQFKKNEKIIEFFNNFDDHLQEDALWAISESIKPRKKS